MNERFEVSEQAKVYQNMLELRIFMFEFYEQPILN